MKSLVLLEPGKLELQEISIPESGHNDVLIKVISAAICHTDFVVMEGQHSWAKYPCVLGHEFSGIIEETGHGVNYLKKGDRVTSLGYSYCGECPFCRRGIHNACINIKGIPFHMDGAFGEFINVPANMVYKISDRLGFEEAALTEPAANGYSAVDRANIYSGEKVVIIGPGPIGLFALQYAKLKQPETLIMNGTRKERLDLAVELGATHAINVRKEDPYKTIMDITSGYGADVVLFCGGGQDAWEMAESILAPFGRVIVEALPETHDTKWPVTVFKFTSSSIGFLGVSGYNGQQFGVALKLLENKQVNASSLITHRFSLDRYQEAFNASLKREDGAIKVLFDIGDK